MQGAPGTGAATRVGATLARAACALLLVPALPACGTTLRSDGGSAGEQRHPEVEHADWDPAWSPDGETIAFVSDRGPLGIFLIGADGSCLRHFGSGMQPAWSPDGSTLAFVDGCHGETAACGIYVANADGSDRRLVVEDAPTAVWIGEHELAFPRDLSIQVVDVRTGETRRLDDYPEAELAQFPDTLALSPDGRHLAYEGGEGVLVRGIGRSSGRWVTSAGGHEPVWSPDGSRLAFQTEGEIGIVNADGTDEQVITRVGDALGPAWSPDGKWIVFTHYVGGGVLSGDNRSALRVVGVDGGEVRNLTGRPIPVSEGCPGRGG